MKTKKPKKQRARLYSSTLASQGKMLSAHLSTELRKALGKRALPLRTDDKVKVMRGSHSGTRGKITKVERKKQRVFIEGLIRKKADGTEVQIPIKASNLLIVELERSDVKRVKGKEIPKVKGEDEKKGTKEEKAEMKKEEKTGNSEAKKEVKKDAGKKEAKEKPKAKK